MFSIQKYWIGVLSLSCCCLWMDIVHSLPYMLLTSTRSKCLSVIAPQGQTITIEYHAPDLKLPEDGDEKEEGQQPPDAAGTTNGSKPEEGADGLDTQWNKRMKERLELMKTKKLRDVSLTVTQKQGLSSGALASRQRKTYNKDDSTTITSGQGRVREELAQRQGKILFLTGEEDGTVEICVQSVMASMKTPARFALKVSMAAATEEEEERLLEEGQKQQQQQQQQEKKKDSAENLEHMEIQSKMSRLERDLQTLQNRVKACLNNADFNKDQEAAFHEQSISMNRAATYWPMIQLMVLLVTGFTQANHIVRYLKTHHIGI